MKPIVHAENNVKKYGGQIKDYLPIHQFMDSSKGAMCDVRHRALTHTSWFIQPDGILEKVFGVTITNSDGKVIAVRDIGEDHIMEDFDGFIPTPQDFLKNIPIEPWMHRGGGTPNDPPAPKVLQIKPEKLEELVKRIETEPPMEWPSPTQPYRSPPWFPGPMDGIQVRDFVAPSTTEYIPYCQIEPPKEHFICHVAEPTLKIEGLGVEETQRVKDTIAENLKVHYSNSLFVDKPGHLSHMIQKVNISADLDQGELFELGAKQPYNRYPEYPGETLYDAETKEPAVQIWQDENGIGVLDLSLVDKFGEPDVKVQNYEGPDGQVYRGLNLDNLGLHVSC